MASTETHVVPYPRQVAAAVQEKIGCGSALPIEDIDQAGVKRELGEARLHLSPSLPICGGPSWVMHMSFGASAVQFSKVVAIGGILLQYCTELLVGFCRA
eukprot:6182568-Pleurochrysis_carterae.AAC.2